jgi:serine/threonine protein kinase
MFNAEADVLAHLSAHPSIVTVYQAGISADGRPYIVMEYCPGSLAQRYRVERMPVAEVLSIGVRMAGALESAHHAGLVHRDVKPSNILVTTFGAPVLADFGISSSLVRQGADEMLAMSEVWSLGATVYSLLAGHSPFERRERGQNSREQLRRRIARASYTEITRTDVPPSLQAVLARAMSRNPADRFATARELGEALQAVQSELGLPGTPLEVPAADWAPAARAIDFADGTLRGPARSRIERESERKLRGPSGVAGLARDEDTDISAPARPARRFLPWALAAATLVAAAAVVVAALLATGVVR